jgi:glycosyltransferase involved in cell wall biosynthesis
MRVLIAHNRYRLPGGEERHIDLLEEGLLEAGVEVRRFERHSSELDASSAKRAAAALALAYRPGGGGIARVVEDWRPDVVHFHNLWPLLTPAALRLARRRGAAVVLTAHNYRFACPGGTLLRDGVVHDDCVRGSSLLCGLRNPRGGLAESVSYGVALELQRRLRMLTRWVDAFIAPSAFMGRMLIRSGLPEARVHVIGYGLPRMEDATGQRGRYALYVGRLSPEKGVTTLLESAAIAREVPVALAGSGPLDADVRDAAVTYLGRLDPPGLRAALAEASFTVAPSEWHDNQPFAVLEAFSAGKPVIATGLGGLPEVVRDGATGLIVPPRSPAALASAMKTLWHRPELTRQLGERARQLARDSFSLERQTRTVMSLYEAVAG